MFHKLCQINWIKRSNYHVGVLKRNADSFNLFKNLCLVIEQDDQYLILRSGLRSWTLSRYEKIIFFLINSFLLSSSFYNLIYLAHPRTKCGRASLSMYKELTLVNGIWAVKKHECNHYTILLLLTCKLGADSQPC